jgi:hypothetical protein
MASGSMGVGVDVTTEAIIGSGIEIGMGATIGSETGTAGVRAGVRTGVRAGVGTEKACSTV